MSRIGRKPVDHNLLRGYAEQWASLFYGIRDGYPGFANPTGKQKASSAHQPKLVGKRKGVIQVTARSHRVHQDAVRAFPPDSTLQYTIRAMVNSPYNEFKYSLLKPVQPDREIWNCLKRAEKANQVERVFKKLRQWALDVRMPFMATTLSKAPLVFDDPKSAAYARTVAKKCLRERTVAAWPLLPFLVSSDWPRKIIKAKRVWTYPRSNRPTSDDKRIEFFARSLAAITLEKSPATATARWLADWHWPKDWYAR